MPVRFTKPTPEEIAWSFDPRNTAISAEYKGEILMRIKSVTLRIDAMPNDMLDMGFPCGETNCWTKASMQFTLATNYAEYQMPLCAKHAKELEEDARTSSV